MRTDIDLINGKNKTSYLRIGKNLYELSNIDSELANQYWTEIKENNFEIIDDDQGKKQMLDILNFNKFNENVSSISDIFSRNGLKKINQENRVAIVVVGDDDLVIYATNYLKNMDMT
ncbi:hypothetical protein [Bacillus cytotoxicus]|uniref:hypothetical protein n=1 Tax=Bacillus cytotoxicus TaxID=580165 RepID=UPI000863CF86|nr:hypothetical protein [Bacillus cytotoxicus]AWC30335.1 hypothetical protein CG483_019720 [Bacillus cytotoxicus]AWC42475.1 hypothetical protein CG480_019740 [Bacillus cytotoxicus]AWC50406.1 hypothetical protein CG478_019740 [Bacillus cytotoxicus]AWC54461.1 hypothetical protein CG477_019920 [Bacillus cytotoxicus]AWC58585.1 hypothetical protein CG476_019945 [Bacillus cytotoxicus]